MSSKNMQSCALPVHSYHSLMDPLVVYSGMNFINFLIIIHAELNIKSM